MPTMEDSVPRVVRLGCAPSPIADNGLCVRFPFPVTYLATDVAVRRNVTQNTPTATTQICSATTQKTTQKSSGTTQKPAHDRIVDCLKAEPTLTRMAPAEQVDQSPDGVRYDLQNLKAAGVIRRVGSDRAGHWEVLG